MVTLTQESNCIKIICKHIIYKWLKQILCKCTLVEKDVFKLKTIHKVQKHVLFVKYGSKISLKVLTSGHQSLTNGQIW